MHHNPKNDLNFDDRFSVELVLEFHFVVTKPASKRLVTREANQRASTSVMFTANKCFSFLWFVKLARIFRVFEIVFFGA